MGVMLPSLMMGFLLLHHLYSDACGQRISQNIWFGWHTVTGLVMAYVDDTNGDVTKADVTTE